MSEDVDTLWRADVGVMELTDTDLEEKRNKYTRISDSSRELHRRLLALEDVWPLDRSATCDRVLRIELADAIDNGRVSFGRGAYDIAYMIPPAGWTRTNDITVNVELPSEDAVTEEERSIGFSTTPTVFDMTKAAVAESTYDTVSDAVRVGCDRILGVL